jgi:predicted NUDIX family NTP pyrophosphohydrolase
MTKQSAGILMYRLTSAANVEVLIVHPGGPLWRKRDEGAWSIPKGEFHDGEDILQTAMREFHEELGTRVSGEFIRLEPIRQKGGKVVHAFAVEGDLDADNIVSNTFALEWPPRSGRTIDVPEVDRAAWYDIPTARQKLNPAQTDFLDQLTKWLGIAEPGA